MGYDGVKLILNGLHALAETDRGARTVPVAHLEVEILVQPVLARHAAAADHGDCISVYPRHCPVKTVGPVYPIPSRGRGIGVQAPHEIDALVEERRLLRYVQGMDAGLDKIVMMIAEEKIDPGAGLVQGKESHRLHVFFGRLDQLVFRRHVAHEVAAILGANDDLRLVPQDGPDDVIARVWRLVGIDASYRQSALHPAERVFVGVGAAEAVADDVNVGQGYLPNKITRTTMSSTRPMTPPRPGTP